MSLGFSSVCDFALYLCSIGFVKVRLCHVSLHWYVLLSVLICVTILAPLHCCVCQRATLAYVSPTVCSRLCVGLRFQAVQMYSMQNSATGLPLDFIPDLYDIHIGSAVLTLYTIFGLCLQYSCQDMKAVLRIMLCLTGPAATT